MLQQKVEMFSTPGAQLRAQFLPTESARKDQTYLDYIEILKQQGLQINPKLFPSFFKLKNGLQYPGVATKQEVGENEILVRVPKKLVLSSFTASQRPELKQIFEDDFYHDEWSWEDRLLNTYLLYIYGKKEESNIWYQMVKHLSKDIDILGFWSEEDLLKFKDLTVKSAADQDKQSFEQQWADFLKIQPKYTILQDPVFTKQNYQWIFIHLTSRSFGKSLQFTSMAPFCEFVNHHCCNGHYDIEKTHSSQQQVEQDQTKSELTSQGSYQSEDYIQIGQFAYDQIQSVPFKWSCNQSFDLNKDEKQQIQDFKQKNIQKLEHQLKWDDYTILFIPFMIQMCNLIENQYIAGRKPFQKAYNDMRALQECIDYYILKIKQSYKLWRHKDYKSILNQQSKKQQNQQKRLEFPKQQKIEYENFILTTGKKDHYNSNNQVYFCYGRNSNRTLLLRYGFALEGNKYQHVWLSFEVIDILRQFPDTLTKIQQKSLSLRRKFKIKYGRLNMELIMFFRLNSWGFYGKKSVEELFSITEYYKEIAILSQIKDSLEFRLEQFEGEYNLLNPNLSYHEYFIQVYHQQKQKILIQHIEFMNELIEFNQLLQNGLTVQNAKGRFSAKQSYTYRHYLTQF